MAESEFNENAHLVTFTSGDCCGLLLRRDHLVFLDTNFGVRSFHSYRLHGSHDYLARLPAVHHPDFQPSDFAYNRPVVVVGVEASTIDSDSYCAVAYLAG